MTKESATREQLAASRSLIEGQLAREVANVVSLEHQLISSEKQKVGGDYYIG